MQEIGKFIVDNWELLVSGLLALIGVLIALFKKKPKSWSVHEYIDFVISNFLPLYIVHAEQSGKTGVCKKLDVIEKCLKYLKGIIDLSDKDIAYATEQFDMAIESILSTPRKKD